MGKKKLKKRPSAFEGDTSILPCDILFSIFFRLSVKSLLRFQSVSKPWKAIISDKEFKNAHLDQAKALNREKLLLQRATCCQFEFRDLESSELIMLEEKQKIPVEKFQHVEVLCSCDGLVLLKEIPGSFKTFVLWNPSTKEHRTLRCPYLRDMDREHPTACGLCYDSTTYDYKVIIVSHTFYVIYSLKTNSWTEKAIFPFPALSYCICSPTISVDGRVFWSLDNIFTQYIDKTSRIVYFDVKLDEVKKLPTPNFIGDHDLFDLTTLRSSLCLYGGNKNSKELHIWIMEQDGSWKLLMNICNLNIICRCFIATTKLLCCTKNDGGVVFQGRTCRTLFIYNLKQQQLVPVPDECIQFPPIASVCLDSLYSFSMFG